VIDLHDAAGWRRFIGLCDGADVLIENLAPDDELVPCLTVLPPRLGADTEDVLVRMLGLGMAAVRRLVADGVAR
jgi:hypothetical protein